MSYISSLKFQTAREMPLLTTNPPYKEALFYCVNSKSFQLWSPGFKVRHRSIYIEMLKNHSPETKMQILILLCKHSEIVWILDCYNCKPQAHSVVNERGARTH